MRQLLFTIAIFAGILLCLTVVNLVKQSSSSVQFAPNYNSNLKGFEHSTEIPGLEELKIQYVNRIKSYNSVAASKQSQWLWISFLVTALMAASTLVSSIKAAKSTGDVSTKSVIIIAILTFLATLGNWGAGQINEMKNTAIQKGTKINEHRSNFYLDFQKASNDSQKEDIVSKYKENLDTM